MLKTDLVQRTTFNNTSATAEKSPISQSQKSCAKKT
jgi:hypothetical protein